MSSAVRRLLKTMRDKDVADRIIIERALEAFKLQVKDDGAP